MPHTLATSSMMCLCRILMLPDKNIGQPAVCLRQNSSTGAGAKVSLELTSIDSVTPSMDIIHENVHSPADIGDLMAMVASRCHDAP
jgi:hypothetical protein